MIIQWQEDDVEMMAQMPVPLLQWAPQRAQSALREEGPVMALWALIGQECGAQELIEYPDGVEFASGWQYAQP